MHSESWFPLFEFQDWVYESYLVLPAAEEQTTPAGSPVTARKWARGNFQCGQAFHAADGAFNLTGELIFRPGVSLAVSLHGALGTGNAPAAFTATGTGVQGPTKGAVYELSGWVFPELPPNAGAARVLSLRGSVRAVRGPDGKPELELGGMPLGTVGAFAIERVRTSSAGTNG